MDALDCSCSACQENCSCWTWAAHAVESGEHEPLNRGMNRVKPPAICATERFRRREVSEESGDHEPSEGSGLWDHEAQEARG